MAAAALLGCAALLAAIRFAPQAAVPYLTLRTTLLLLNVTTDGGRAMIGARLRENESAPLVVAHLTGSPAAQWRMLDALRGANRLDGPWDKTEAVEALLLGFCVHSDPQVR